MTYLFVLLASFIGVLFLMQLILFEMTRSKMVKAGNIKWFLSLKKPFHYTRVRYMMFLCLFCYFISSPDPIFSGEWFVYLILFIAMGIVSDAVVQYLILTYGKRRCHKDIEEADSLLNELTHISETMSSDEDYEKPAPQYNEEEILKKYIDPDNHIAILSIDEGTFAKNIKDVPEAMFVIEPYTDHETVKSKFIDSNVKVTELTPSGQMPFKDEKMDVVMCLDCNYTKEEVKRVLKPNGYFLVNQKGTTNYKEFLSMYMPFGMKGSWDAYSCAQTLESVGMRIVDKYEEYATIRFHSIQSMYTYFQKESTDIANIEKYQMFYLKALQDIRKQNFFEITTHRFLVVSQKV